MVVVGRVVEAEGTVTKGSSTKSVPTVVCTPSISGSLASQGSIISHFSISGGNM